MNEVWLKRGLELAEFVSKWSKDPSTKVGAAILDSASNRILGVGYNGFARGVADTEERLSNRDLKYKLVLHAEENAIMFSSGALEGATIFTWPFLPCPHCASLIIQKGIDKVVTTSPQLDHPRWGEMFDLSVEILQEGGVGRIYLDDCN